MNSKPSTFAALVTPVGGDGTIDSHKLAVHGKWVLENGCDGLTLFGTTGEAVSFPVGARTAALEALLKAGMSASSLIVGTGCCSISDTVVLSRHALELGCQGVLVHPPFFFKNPGEGGVFDFYGRIIDGIGDSEAKLLLYHFPEMTSVPISYSLIERLLTTFPSVIAGLKDSSGDLDNMKELVRRFPNLRVFSGDDHLLWPLLEAGGHGAITATANLTPNLLRDIARGWKQNSPEALLAQETLVGLWEQTLLKFPVSEAIKEIMAERSGDADWRQVCPPLKVLDPYRREQLLAMLQPFLGAIPAGLGVLDHEAATI